MLSQYTSKQRKQLGLYFRCLSAHCLTGMLKNYYVAFDFDLGERLFRKSYIVYVLKIWNIKDAEDLKKVIAWLMEDGFRYEYKRMHSQLFALNEASRLKYLEESREEQDYTKLDVVHKCLNQLPSGDISAYGGSWVILLCRIGILQQYLSEEEAWEYQLKAATMLQQNYSSWDDYFVAYSCGSHFSAIKPGIHNYYYVTGMLDLMTNGTLLNKKLAWDQQLLPK
ncbi:hypothetical protein D3C73_517260 [compost metagenome]